MPKINAQNECPKCLKLGLELSPRPTSYYAICVSADICSAYKYVIAEINNSKANGAPSRGDAGRSKSLSSDQIESAGYLDKPEPSCWRELTELRYLNNA